MSSKKRNRSPPRTPPIGITTPPSSTPINYNPPRNNTLGLNIAKDISIQLPDNMMPIIPPPPSSPNDYNDENNSSSTNTPKKKKQQKGEKQHAGKSKTRKNKKRFGGMEDQMNSRDPERVPSTLTPEYIQRIVRDNTFLEVNDFDPLAQLDPDQTRPTVQNRLYTVEEVTHISDENKIRIIARASNNDLSSDRRRVIDYNLNDGSYNVRYENPPNRTGGMNHAMKRKLKNREKTKKSKTKRKSYRKKY